MRLFADMIDAFARAEGPPPDRLWRFMRWALAGAFPAIGFGLARLGRGRRHRGRLAAGSSAG